MKKRLPAFIISAALAFSAVSCGKADSKNKDDANTVKIAYLPITHSLAVLEEAEELVEKLGAEFAAWFRYVIERKTKTI